MFWISVGVVVYTYAGYPLLLYLRSRWVSRQVRTVSIEPTISVVIAVRNEVSLIAAKLRNLSLLSYPANRFEVIFVSDGSTDGTVELLSSSSNDRLRVISCQEHVGKAEALNRAIAQARGEIVVFTDVRQALKSDSLRHLVDNFGDPAVGCVSGELFLGNAEDGAPLHAAGLYWNLEKKIRQWEGITGSVIGATGALYAVRRELLRPLPPGAILDDVYIPMQVVRQGRRVVFEPEAQAWDRPPASPTFEFRRKVRTLTGNYQLLQLAPWLLTWKNPVLFEFVSHKILRLLVPFALVGTLVSSLLLNGPFYRFVEVLQILLYTSAVLAVVPARVGGVGRLANVTLTVIVLNAAAVVALFYFLTGKKEVWAR